MATSSGPLRHYLQYLDAAGLFPGRPVGGKSRGLAGVGRRQRRARQKTAAPTAQFASDLDFGLTSLDFC
eukprot:COSAG04_NODE_1664_length_6014_cov_7.936422_5_plen_69_part_00